MDIEDLVLLKTITDILIHTPITDALSAFATEALYAGSILITGAWLPYGPFRRTGLEYFEIEDIANLNPLLIKTLDHGIKNYKPDITKQQKAIEDTFFPRPTSQMWLSIYNELINN
jgi:ABC-type Fe3+-hydroxamate transport system substrate-binding protein